MSETGAPSSALPSAIPLPRVPLTFGQILDRVFRLLRAHWRPFIGVGALPAGLFLALYAGIVAAMLTILQPWHPANPAVIPARMGILLVAMPVFYIAMLMVFALYYPAIVSAALDADAGVNVTVGGAWAAAFKKAGRYLWLMILCALIVVGPVILIGTIVAGVAVLLGVAGKSSFGPQQMILLVPFAILFDLGILIYSVIATIWVSLACPAAIAEDLPARAAIARSFRLTRGARGRIFLLLLVLYAISYAVMIVVELVFLFLGSLVALGMIALHVPLVPWGIVAIVVAAICLLVVVFFFITISWAAYFTASVVVYRDQRLRQEGPAAALPTALPAQ